MQDATRTAPAPARRFPSSPVLSEEVVPFSECRGKLAEYLDKTRRTHRPVVVTQNGRPTSVIVNILDWEAIAPAWDAETLEILEDIRVAEEEADRGETISQEEFIQQLRAEGRL